MNNEKTNNKNKVDIKIWLRNFIAIVVIGTICIVCLYYLKYIVESSKAYTDSDDIKIEMESTLSRLRLHDEDYVLISDTKSPYCRYVISDIYIRDIQMVATVMTEREYNKFINDEFVEHLDTTDMDLDDEESTLSESEEDNIDLDIEESTLLEDEEDDSTEESTDYEAPVIVTEMDAVSRETYRYYGYETHIYYQVAKYEDGTIILFEFTDLELNKVANKITLDNYIIK